MTVVLFFSTNGGTNWAAVNAGLTVSDVCAFAVSPNGAGGTNLFVGTAGGGAFLSTNGGTSWTAVDSGLTDSDVYTFAVSPNGAGGTSLFAGSSSSGVFLSTNTGKSWTAVSAASGILNVTALAVSPNGAGGTNLFAGTVNGVFLSTNSGTSWTAVDSGLAYNDVSALAVSGRNIFAGTWTRAFPSANSATTENGVFLSTNNGTSWAAADSGLPGTAATVKALAVSGTNLFAGSWHGVFLSTDNGTSWTAVNSGLTDTHVYALAISGTNLFAGTVGAGVWRRPLSEMITGVSLLSIASPKRFTLEQNYPNPFNPGTIIRYALPSRAHVTLSVYNTLGQQVAVLVNGEVDPGNHDVWFDGSNIASGVYFYRIQAGSFIQTKKLMLLH